jgi:hypothetical protein
MAEAKRAAGDKERTGPQPATAQLARAASLLDELDIHLIPGFSVKGAVSSTTSVPEHIELDPTRVLEGTVSPTCTTCLGLRSAFPRPCFQATGGDFRRVPVAIAMDEPQRSKLRAPGQLASPGRSGSTFRRSRPRSVTLGKGESARTLRAPFARSSMIRSSISARCAGDLWSLMSVKGSSWSCTTRPIMCSRSAVVTLPVSCSSTSSPTRAHGSVSCP